MVCVPGKLILDGNAVATVNHIPAFETLFRFGIQANYRQIGPRVPTVQPHASARRGACGPCGSHPMAAAVCTFIL
jgi:hypothetical protein